MVKNNSVLWTNRRPRFDYSSKNECNAGIGLGPYQDGKLREQKDIKNKIKLIK